MTITNAQQTPTPNTPEAAIIVNSVGAFSNASILGRPLIADSLHKIPGGTPRAQVFLPLHELAHLTGGTQHHTPDPTGQANDTAIEKKCKQTLHGATR